MGHEWRFVRAACHVAHRANKRLACIQPAHLAFATPYLPRPFNEAAYMTAIRRELHIRRPIREILATAPPAEFLLRWNMATEPDPVDNVPRVIG